MICTGWQKAADLAKQKNLTPDRARKLIETTVSDVTEAAGQGLSNERLKSFFEKAAELAGQGSLTKDRLQSLIGEKVGEIVTLSGQTLPAATIRDWCRRWLELKSLENEPSTHERYRGCIEHFLDFLGPPADRDLNTLRVDDVIRFRDSAAQRLAVASANLELKIVRVCLSAAVKQDLAEKNVASRVAVLKRRGESKRRGFTLEEVHRVLKQCDIAGGEWRGLVLMAVYTGQRLGDVARLTWSQVDLAAGHIAFVTEKTGHRLSFSLAAPLRAFLEAAPSADDPTAYVFPNAASMAEKRVGSLSNKFYDEILAPAGLVPARPTRHAATKSGRDAKRKQAALSFHSFRHSFTTWLKAAGASNAMAEMIVGHDSEVVSRGYTHLSADDTANAINRLPDVTHEDE